MYRNLSVALLASFLFTLPASALFYFGGGEAVLITTAELEYDSNIGANSMEEEDFIARGFVGLNYIRPFRHFDLGGGVGLRGLKYFDHSQRDDLNWEFNIFLSPTAEFGTRFWTLSTDIGIRRVTKADEDRGELVTTDNYWAGATLTITPTPRYYVETGIQYMVTDPKDLDIAERRTLRNHAAAGWKLGPRYFIFGRIDREETRTDRDYAPVNRIDNLVWSYSVGLNGQISNRLSGSASVGISQRKIGTTGETDSTPIFSLGLDYVVDRLTTARLSGSRYYTASLLDTNQTNTQLMLSVDRTLRRDLTGTGYVSFIERRFLGMDRRDHAYTGGFILSYDVAAWGRLEWGASHTMQESRDPNFDYNRTRVFVQLNGSF